ncbi:hypothetical protein H310_02169 [Aphanomyces invadans]|uniref:Uncharacterized protein n=1 Tax=Aphanomyces invadans TaxID=157072 RepID=A0A024UPE7_9STRA|nr:hypothetical protein H310_02169 [Aphanomyces invadans]ETW07722.1 hypothetical protein H310_02169 [Aphanomyces invadans]|eukprot:XP_008863815.1 hypothetical protein H310_02169 [Aphanomyces invadans]
MPRPSPGAVALATLLWSLSAQNLGNVNRTVSEACEALKIQLDKLWIDQKQMKEGVVAGAVTATDCKELHDINVMDYRTNEQQAALCSNPCYNNTASTYASMLNLDCFQGQDEYEVANQRLFAASFQYGCQQDAAEQYCVPLVGLTMQKAGSKYDLCSDIVNKIGCCFESYKRYMSFGTSRSVEEMTMMTAACADKVSDIAVPCKCNPGNAYASSIKNVLVCSYASERWPCHAQVLLVALAAVFTFVWL